MCDRKTTAKEIRVFCSASEQLDSRKNQISIQQCLDFLHSIYLYSELWSKSLKKIYLEIFEQKSVITRNINSAFLRLATCHKVHTQQINFHSREGLVSELG